MVQRKAKGCFISAAGQPCPARQAGHHQDKLLPDHDFSPSELGPDHLQRIVVFPALSSPSTRMRASFSPNTAISLDIQMPMMSCQLPLG